MADAEAAVSEEDGAEDVEDLWCRFDPRAPLVAVDVLEELAAADDADVVVDAGSKDVE